MTPFRDPKVAAVFEGYPPRVRRKLLTLRELILDVAAKTEGVGAIEEALRWGEPAYLTPETRSGTTVRIAWKASAPDQVGMYFHCQTNLVAGFREQFSDQLHFEGNRGIVLRRSERVPKKALAVCIATALTYHRDKKALRS